MIRVGKGDAPEIIISSGYLLHPGVPSIGGSEDCAKLTDSRSGIGIGKGHTEECVARWACLAHPRAAGIYCADDGSKVANGRSVVCITKGNVFQRKDRNCA